MSAAYETQAFDGAPVTVVVTDWTGARKQRAITLAVVADVTGMDKESLRNIIKRNPETFDGWTLTVTLTDNLGRPRETTVLTRDGALALLLKISTNQIEDEGKRQQIIRFQRWAATTLGEVIEAGTASSKDILANPDFLVELATRYRDEHHARLAAEAKVLELAPKADFHDQVTQAVNCIEIGEFAKLMIGTGPIRFFKWLREQKILRADNLPRQEHIDAGRLRVEERTRVDKRDQKHTYLITLVTGKGQPYLQKRWAQAGNVVQMQLQANG